VNELVWGFARWKTVVVRKCDGGRVLGSNTSWCELWFIIAVFGELAWCYSEVKI
jgi:hypothetical protein